MKIALISSSIEQCGIAEYARQLTKGMAGEVEIDFIPIDQAPALLSEEDIDKLATRANKSDLVHIQHEHAFFPDYKLEGLSIFEKLKRVINPGKFSFFVLLNSIKKPTVLTLHELTYQGKIRWGDSPFKDTLVKKLKAYYHRLTYGSSGRVITHCDEKRDALVEFGVSEDKISVIPIGIPPVENSMSDMDAKAKLGLQGKFVLTIFGFVNHRKGHLNILDIMPDLPDNVFLLIAGGPHPADKTGYYSALKNRIAELGLESRVRITGFLSDDEVESAMKASELVVVPFDEMAGNSYSTLSAVAYGKPVLGWDLPALVEMNKRLNCLRIVKKGDKEQLAKEINYFCANPTELKALSQASKKAAENCSVRVEVAAIMNLYGKMLSENSMSDNRVKWSWWDLFGSLVN